MPPLGASLVAVSVSENVEVSGHLMDSGILSRVLQDIREYGGDYVIDRFDVGHEVNDISRASLVVTAEDDESLQRLLMRLQTRGVNQVDPGEASVSVAEQDGVFPDGFYSTTNLATKIRLGGRWLDVENPEMDCGLIVEGERVYTLPMSDVSVGMQVVTGASGIKVNVPVNDKSGDSFGFMDSDVSSEKPQAVLVRQVADGMREARKAGKKVLWVGGPGVVHTGAAPAMVALVDAGFVDVLFAGNALATHDIESSLYGTSLGVDLAMGRGVEHGHEHHIRALNTIRKHGSIKAAVDNGVLTGGIMHALVKHEKRFVLVGSVRDDGPLPDVYTDVIEGQRAMRAEIADVGFCLMVATMLHSVATGNILPASIPLVCVDINPATVTKLSDRGSSQAKGIVTDVGLFLEQLALELVPGYRRD
ncbi:MAG: bifunctional enzyme conserved domain protein [Nocardioides sp.]|jgi:lysine-ketoglutarate reductase/saccharopine dehydrogenase-like protein (TIGR00300 family)|nr:bifunctional enzyme conserved domain protein [Nocardioides sp.]